VARVFGCTEANVEMMKGAKSTQDSCHVLYFIALALWEWSNKLHRLPFANEHTG
jgi:hypothetical protein